MRQILMLQIILAAILFLECTNSTPLNSTVDSEFLNRLGDIVISLMDGVPNYVQKLPSSYLLSCISTEQKSMIQNCEDLSHIHAIQQFTIAKDSYSDSSNVNSATNSSTTKPPNINNNPHVETIQHQNTVTSQQTTYVHVPLRSRLSDIGNCILNTIGIPGQIPTGRLVNKLGLNFINTSSLTNDQQGWAYLALSSCLSTNFTLPQRIWPTIPIQQSAKLTKLNRLTSGIVSGLNNPGYGSIPSSRDLNVTMRSLVCTAEALVSSGCHFPAVTNMLTMAQMVVNEASYLLPYFPSAYAATTASTIKTTNKSTTTAAPSSSITNNMNITNNNTSIRPTNSFSSSSINITTPTVPLSSSLPTSVPTVSTKPSSLPTSIPTTVTTTRPTLPTTRKAPAPPPPPPRPAPPAANRRPLGGFFPF